MKDSIKQVLDAGFEVLDISTGAYMRKVDNCDGDYLYQTSYRSSNYGSFDSMSERFLSDTKKEEAPDVEPECSASEEERDESGIECEFELKNGSWWCSTHNCSA